MAPPKTTGATRGTIHGTVFNGLVSYTIRAMPIPPKISEFLSSHSATMAKMLSSRAQSTDEDDEQDSLETGEGVAGGARIISPEQFWKELEALCQKAGGEWVGAADRIWAFGPKRLGANLVLDPQGKFSLRLRGKENIIAKAREGGASADEALATTDNVITEDQLAKTTADEETTKAELRLLRDFENSVEAGFQMATFQGPLCSEPVVGMAWVVESIEHKPEEEETEQGESYDLFVT